ncbi:MAG TPA: FtsX-like permease family protein [Thermoanaerobaculia bacterium]|nr:FtsX-like permease family protein [Thermoanaerobaculia bacterium]
MKKVIILTIGLVVGADATIFSALNAILLKPLPVAQPEQLFRLAAVNSRGETREDVSYADFVALRDAYPSLAAFTSRGNTELVSDNFFDVLGAKLARGTTGVVISAELERRLFNGDALGRTIEIDGKRETVTGIAAAPFRGTNFAAPADVWIPLDRSTNVRVMGRLAGDATLVSVQETLSRVLPDKQRVRAGAERPMLIQPGAPRTVTFAITIAMTLMALAALVAAANIIGILFARIAVRRRDLAIRVALGATPARVMRELVLETIPLAIPAAILAYVIAILGSRVYLARIPMQSRPPIDMTPDFRVALFAFAMSVAAVFCASLIAALYARRTSASELTSRGGSARTPNVLRWIVSAQLALSMVVLVAAGLLLQTARAYRAVDPGFEYTKQLRVTVDNVPLPRLRALAEQLRAMAGTTHVAIATNAPLSRQARMTFRGLDGEPIEGNVTYIDGDYFGAVGIPLLQGTAGTVVNEALAKRRPDLPITGIARDARLSALADPAAPHLFLPIVNAPRTTHLLMRTTRTPADVHAVLARYGIVATTQRLEDSVRVDRWLAETASIVAGALAALTLLLAAVGLFGVVSMSVNNRARELAIRAAHGATPLKLARLIAASSARFLIAGGVAGALLSIPAARSLAALLFGVTAFDTLTWTAVLSVLCLTVLCATVLPARRAMSVSPTDLLRET